MVKSNLLAPAHFIVAALAPCPELTAVRVVFLVTRVAICLQLLAIEIALVAGSAL